MAPRHTVKAGQIEGCEMILLQSNGKNSLNMVYSIHP